MHTTSPPSDASPGRTWPAWVFSLAVHGGAVLVLASGLEGAPRGGTEEPLRSAGIVLRRVSAEGVAYATGDDDSEDTVAKDESPPAETKATQNAEGVTIASEGAETTQTPSNPATAAVPEGTAPNTSSPRGTPRSGSPAEGYAEVSVFGVPGKGNKFVYVFDRSASMEGPPLAAAKRQLVESLQSLDSLHQFHIIFFNHRLRSFDITSGSRRIAFGTERNKKLAANFVGGITADGGTDRFVALKQALAFRPDVVFFLTDADDPMSASEMAEIERIQSRIGTAICVIEFGRSATQPQSNFLIELARLSGGQYGYVNTTKLKP